VVHLLRHGRTALNAEGLLRGRLDPSLDEVGVAEAEALARAFEGRAVGALVSSPLSRARQTAEPIAEACNVGMSLDEGLADRDYGPWAGRAPAELRQLFGSVDAAPGVETMASVAARAIDAVIAAARRAAPRCAVVVSHEAVNRLVLTSLIPELGDWRSLPQPTGCWNQIQRSEGRWHARVVGALPPGDSGR
jgi:broad specificity phosphatase PhoE